MHKPKVIVIGGPTASGKTALSIELAKKINAQIMLLYIKTVLVYHKYFNIAVRLQKWLAAALS